MHDSSEYQNKALTPAENKEQPCEEHEWVMLQIDPKLVASRWRCKRCAREVWRLDLLKPPVEQHQS